MSRSAFSLVALGLSMSLAAACGDDADVIAVGGSGGTGGSSGAAGNAGTGGTAGVAGAAGTGGAAGTAGAAGDGGTGGTTGGTGGTGGATGGTGGTVELPDAGADAAAPDGGELADAGGEDVLTRECPADFDVLLDLADGPNNQPLGFSRIEFRDGGADVTFVGLGEHNFAPPQVLCTGSATGDCDENVQDLLPGSVDAGTALLTEGEEVTIFTSGVDPAAGELALVNSPPDEDEGADDFIFAYIAWGTFASVGPVGGGDSLEARAVAAGFWTLNDRVDVGTDTTIFVQGDVNTAAGYDACTPDD